MRLPWPKSALWLRCRMFSFGGFLISRQPNHIAIDAKMTLPSACPIKTPLAPIKIPPATTNGQVPRVFCPQLNHVE